MTEMNKQTEDKFRCRLREIYEKAEELNKLTSELRSELYNDTSECEMPNSILLDKLSYAIYGMKVNTDPIKDYMDAKRNW